MQQFQNMTNYTREKDTLIQRDRTQMTYNLLNMDAYDNDENKFDPDEFAVAKCLLNYNVGPTSVVAFGDSNKDSEKESRACLVVAPEKSRQNMALIGAASRRKRGSLLKLTVDGYKTLRGKDKKDERDSLRGEGLEGAPRYLCPLENCPSTHSPLSAITMADMYNFNHRMNVRELSESSGINLSEQEYLQYSRHYNFNHIRFWFSRKSRNHLIDKIIGKCQLYCIQVNEQMIKDFQLVYLSECQEEECICCQIQFSDVNSERRRGLIQVPAHLYDEEYMTKNVENLSITLETITFLCNHLRKGSVPSRDFLSCLGHDQPELTVEQLQVVFPCIFCRIFKDNSRWSRSPVYGLLIKEDLLRRTQLSTDKLYTFNPTTAVTKQDLIPSFNITGGPKNIYDYCLNIRQVSSFQSSFRPYTINLMALRKYCIFD